MQGKGLWPLLVAVCAMAATATGALASHGTLGHTTLDQTIVPASQSAGYRQLAIGPGSPPRIVREDGIGVAQAERHTRRTSLAYFGQLSDFQLADEESPARVEFVDPLNLASSAFRPWEAMEPHIDDAMIRQINALAAASPVPSGDGSQRAMDFNIMTGDNADSQQLNETQAVQALLDGGVVNPNSGADPAGSSTHPLCQGQTPIPGQDPPFTAAEAAKYTGVQDYDDYDETQVAPSANPGPPPYPPYFYDPDAPAGNVFAGFPTHTGLMDKAQESFTAAGLQVDSYLAFGNHDGLVQGTVGATSVFETAATGCIKILTGNFPSGRTVFSQPPNAWTVQDVLDLRQQSPGKTFLVPPDPNRRFVSKQQYKDIFKAGPEPNGHGFDEIDAAEEAASNNNAGYYSFEPVDGIRMIALDTISEGGFIANASDGNIDHPQYQWLEAELQAATAAKELVMLFSHHAPDSFQNPPGTADEFPGPCGATDSHGHHIGCDIDPRPSTPLHLRDDMIALLHRYPNVIAWLAGHSHTNKVQAFPRGDGYGFWVLRVAAEADWPQQARLLELFDNEDGTLSLFGTLVDHASPATAPTGPATAFSTDQLASVARTIAYNDPQSGARACTPNPCGEGAPADRNVELLVNDPRLIPPPSSPPPVAGGSPPQASPLGTTCKAKKKKKKKRKKKKKKKC